MSETISTLTPAAPPTPAVTPSSTGADSPASPPAAQQPPISISDAARLLAQQRRQQAQQGPPGSSPGAGSTPAEAKVPAQATPATPEAQKPQAAPAKPADPALDSIAKALGLEGAPATDSAAVPEMPAIEVDGRRMTAEEVRRAVSMAADYTKKTQALAEAQRQFQAQQEALATVLPYIQPELARLQQQIAGIPRPDPKLIETNHQEYLRQFAAWQAAQDEQGRLGQLQTLQHQAAERALAARVEESNRELAKQFPDWADPQRRSEWQQKIAEWAMDRGGFQRQELAQLADHRQLTVLMKAMMFDRMIAGAKTSAPVRAAPVRGQTPPPAPTERVSSAEQAFEAKPSIRNATQLLTARRAR